MLYPKVQVQRIPPQILYRPSQKQVVHEYTFLELPMHKSRLLDVKILHSRSPMIFVF